MQLKFQITMQGVSFAGMSLVLDDMLASTASLVFGRTCQSKWHVHGF